MRTSRLLVQQHKNCENHTYRFVDKIAFVRSGMEYASIIWDPHFIKDSDALERVQRRAARWITSISTIGVQALPLCYTSFTLNLWRNADASVDWLSCIKFWTSMWRCRWISWIWFCVIDLSEDLLLNRLNIPRCATTQFQKSFAARTITEWNSLPDSVTSLASVSSFRSQLSATSCP